MKPRLHIPLRTNQTTRQRRRVVWLLVEAIIAILIVWTIGRVFLLRTTIASLAPEGTDLTVSLVGTAGRELLIKRFLHNELVSNRPLTVEVLKEELGREVAIFFDFNAGTRSFALSGRLSVELQETLKTYGLIVTPVGASTFLSEDPSQIPLPRKTSLHLTAILPNYIGWAKTKDDAGAVRLSQNKLTLKVQTGVDSQLKSSLREQVVSATTIEKWTDLEAFGITAGGDVLITQDERGTGYRITINELVETQNLARLLKESAMSKAVELSNVLLPDSSSVIELVVDPESISIEIVEENGLLYVVISTKTEKIYAKREGMITVITNREELLEEQSEKVITPCFPNAGSYVFPSVMTEWTRGFLENAKEIAISKDFVGICW